MILITHLSWVDVVNLTVVFAKLRYVRGFPRWEIPEWLRILEETTFAREVAQIELNYLYHDDMELVTCYCGNLEPYWPKCTRKEQRRCYMASIKRDCRCVGLDGDCIPECAEINKAQA